jgi:MSHA pilin protein MshD
MFINKSQLGLSLVEQIVFIVIVSVAVAGVLGVFAMTSRGSADPMVQKQALSIAEAFMEEVQLQPFTYCDPDDANGAAATRAALDSGVTLPAVGCAATIEVLGVDGGENRYSATTPFDNVNDYNGYDSSVEAPPGIKNIAQQPIAGLEPYRVVVNVAGQALGGIGDDVDGRPRSLLITVTVTGPGNTTVVLHGYRARYAPNALP